MNIEFFENFNADYPSDAIVCFTEFSREDLTSLSNFIDSLIFSSCESWLTDSYFIKDSKIRFLFKLSEYDEGILEINKDQMIYHCVLTKQTFIKINELLNHFINSGMKGYQWLYDLNTNIDLLLSSNGKW